MAARQRILMIVALAFVLAAVVGTKMFMGELESAREIRDAAIEAQQAQEP